MSTSAVIVMILSIGLLWGGMTLAILSIRRHPDTQRQDPAEAGSEHPPTGEDRAGTGNATGAGPEDAPGGGGTGGGRG